MDGDGHFRHEETWKDLKRKKKRDKIHTDYYKFKIDNDDKNDMIYDQKDSIDDEKQEELDEDKLENPDYLKERKQQLKKMFSKKIKKNN